MQASAPSSCLPSRAEQQTNLASPPDDWPCAAPANSQVPSPPGATGAPPRILVAELEARLSAPELFGHSSAASGAFGTPPRGRVIICWHNTASASQSVSTGIFLRVLVKHKATSAGSRGQDWNPDFSFYTGTIQLCICCASRNGPHAPRMGMYAVILSSVF